MSKVATPKAPRETTVARRERLSRESLAGGPKVAKKPASVVAKAPALASPRVSAERLALAKFVVKTRDQTGKKIAWSKVADAVEKRTSERPTGSQLRRLYYLGGGPRSRA